MDLVDAIHGRRSVRDYRAEPLNDATLRGLMDAAVWAPSAINEQPWHFTVVRDQRKLDLISQLAKQYMLTTQAAVPDHLRAMLTNPDFQIFYHAPALMVISAALGPWAVEDCALAAQNLMLSAHSQGLGSCWIGFAESWLQTPDGKAMLQLPAEFLPVAPIIVGLPNATPPVVPRKATRVAWIG
jgi:nitroreductase